MQSGRRAAATRTRCREMLVRRRSSRGGCVFTTVDHVLAGSGPLDQASLSFRAVCAGRRLHRGGQHRGGVFPAACSADTIGSRAPGQPSRLAEFTAADRPRRTATVLPGPRLAAPGPGGPRTTSWAAWRTGSARRTSVQARHRAGHADQPDCRTDQAGVRAFFVAPAVTQRAVDRRPQCLSIRP